MYFYYQKGEKAKWEAVPANKDVEKLVRSYGATKLTVLSVSEIIDDENTDKAELRYQGPLYFDIDCKGDLKQAAVSARSLTSSLVGLGLQQKFIKVYASGGKGFHIMVPAKSFGSGKPTKSLPKIYSSMALELFVHGLDFQVYSGKRGNSWRLSNIERGDGNYRVRIAHSELEALADASAEQAEAVYRSLVKSPRPDDDILGSEVVKAPALSTLFERCKKRVADQTLEKEASALRPLDDEKAETLGENVPECVELLSDYRVKPHIAFNKAGMQFAAWAARSKADKGTWRSRLNRMADAGSSNKYDSHTKRAEHLESLVHYAKSNKGFKFSCHAMRQVVGISPCDGCPIGSETLKDEAHEDGLELGIEARADGYYLLGQEKDRRISTFTLEPVSTTVEKAQSEDAISRRVSTHMEIHRYGTCLGTVSFEEGGWASKSSFIRQIEGVHNLSFTGSDADVQRIKHIVYNEGKDMSEVIKVYASGVHLHRESDKETLVYVEPGNSITEFNVRGTYEVSGRVSVPPRIWGEKLPQSEEDRQRVSEALQALLQVNSREIVAQIVGWYTACHLKTHFMKRYTQFPILSLWGSAGSGKSMSASLFAWINGVDYSLNDSPLNISSVTQWVMIHYCSSSMTVPRLLDEYNRSKISKRQYDQAGEIIKASWNGQTIGRGTLAKSRANGRTGAEVAEIPITGPLVVMSEQAPETPAVQQRTIQVMLTRKARAGCEGHFNRASQLRQDLRKIAKGLVIKSLETPVSWIEQEMESYDGLVPRDVDERPRYSYKVAFIGLDFLEKCVKEMGLDDGGHIEELRQALKDYLERESGEIRKSKHRTEVDAVLEDIGTMVALSSDGSDRWIDYGKHVWVDMENRRLYLDLPIVHAMYLRYKGGREDIPLYRLSQFGVLLKQEIYFVNDRVMMERMNASRPMWELDLDRMEEKDHIVTMFQG